MSKSRTEGVAERLRQAREAAGLSQGQAARKMNLHRPTVTEIEAGRRKVTAAELAELSSIYGVSVQWIVSGADEDSSANTKLLLAARELSRMSDADLDRLMSMLKMLRNDD